MCVLYRSVLCLNLRLLSCWLHVLWLLDGCCQPVIRFRWTCFLLRLTMKILVMSAVSSLLGEDCGRDLPPSKELGYFETIPWHHRYHHLSNTVSTHGAITKHQSWWLPWNSPLKLFAHAMQQVDFYFTFLFFAHSISLDIKCWWCCWDKTSQVSFKSFTWVFENVKRPNNFNILTFVSLSSSHAPWPGQNTTWHKSHYDQALDYMRLIHSVKQ